MPVLNRFRRRAHVVAFVALAAVLAPGLAVAQGKLGAYAGTIEVSHAIPNLTYTARVQVSMPVTHRSASQLDAEFLAGEGPPAKVAITRWDTFKREKSADSGGQFNTLACSLAGPVEIPMTATGVLNLDLRKKTHVYSLVLISLKNIPLNCKHSRSGAHKRSEGIALMLGTGVPGSHFQNPLPFTDLSRLAAKYTLVPPGASPEEQGPIVQAWDLKLTH